VVYGVSNNLILVSVIWNINIKYDSRIYIYIHTHTHS
jgi:hypothetical protein